MNCLNSVILEGVFKSITTSENQVEFVVSSTRCEPAANGEKVEVITEVPCLALHSVMESVKKNGRPGRGVRVVGHLAGPLNGSVLLVCEHIEYRGR